MLDDYFLDGVVSEHLILLNFVCFLDASVFDAYMLDAFLSGCCVVGYCNLM